MMETTKLVWHIKSSRELVFILRFSVISDGGGGK